MKSRCDGWNADYCIVQLQGQRVGREFTRCEESKLVKGYDPEVDWYKKDV